MLSAEQVAEAVRLRVARGWTVDRIAREFHVHSTTLGRYLIGAGVQVEPMRARGRPMETESLLKTLELCAVGYSALDIAQLTGLHPTSVRWRLRKYGRPDVEWRRRPHRVVESVPG